MVGEEEKRGGKEGIIPPVNTSPEAFCERKLVSYTVTVLTIIIKEIRDKHNIQTKHNKTNIRKEI